MLCCIVRPSALYRPHGRIRGNLMFVRAGRSGGIERRAIGLSGLCLVHCVAPAVLVLMLASAGGILVDPRIHEVGLALAIALGALGLGRGLFEQGYMMASSIGGVGGGRQ